jgi:hypothetical protein
LAALINRRARPRRKRQRTTYSAVPSLGRSGRAGASCKPKRCIVAGDWVVLQVRRARYRTAIHLLVQRNLVFDLYQCRSPRWRRDCNYTKKTPTRETENKNKQRRVAMTTTCAKCGEALIAPDWSEFVSEHLAARRARSRPRPSRKSVSSILARGRQPRSYRCFFGGLRTAGYRVARAGGDCRSPIMNFRCVARPVP